MIRKMIAWVLTLAMVVSLFPAAMVASPAALEETVASQSKVLYVRADGSDEKGDGTQEQPYATLAKAVAVAPEDAPSTIYVMSNLTMNDSARFWNKHITITSSGEDAPYTISRGDEMKPVDDAARSAYNPAMIEAQANSGNGVYGLRLENIVLDDGGKYEGTVFAQAVSGDDNTTYVQDAMVASNATVPCTLTLGAGAVLRNYGGMSAVRVTSDAKLVMEAGSVIEDTIKMDRLRGAEGSVGPAGAVWSQGGEVIVEAGAIIQNTIGRAIYADGGDVEMNGTIQNVTGNKTMWQADQWNGTPGTALHLRNKAQVTVSGTIDGCTKGVNIEVIDSTLTMTEKSVLQNGKDAINIVSSENVQLNGEITGFTGRSESTEGGHVLNMSGQGNPMNCTIGATGNIHDNACSYGAIYIQAPHGKLDIYGKINNNTTNDRAGAIAMAHNFLGHVVTMYDGAEMIGNSSTETGGAMMVSGGTFIMEGGTIEKNHAAHEGGGVYIRNGGKFVMKGGTISGNTSDKVGGGVAFLATDWGETTPYCDLQGGTIRNNIDINGSNDVAVLSGGSGHNERYFRVEKGMQFGNSNLNFAKDGMTFIDPMRDVKYGNASEESEKVIADALKEKKLSSQVASFWFNSGKRPLPLTVSLPASKLKADKPVFAGVVATDEFGNPMEGAVVKLYAVNKDANGNYRVDMPGGLETTRSESDASIYVNGFAVMFVQEGDASPHILTITPADTVVYKNAVIGHKGVVNEKGEILQTSNLPTPGFYIEGLPSGTNPEALSLEDKEGKRWKIESYDGKSNRVYRIVPADPHEQLLRLTFTDREGREQVDSDFDVSKANYNTLFINLYRAEEDGPVTATIAGEPYQIVAGTGLLTIRAVSEEVDVVEVQKQAPTTKVEKATAVVPEGVFFTINAGDVQVTNRGPALLSDNIPESGYNGYGGKWNEAMIRRIDKELGGVRSTRQHAFMYLDFVDAANGRLWLTPSDKVEIYFPYPEGVDQNSNFTLMRFKGLYRGTALEDVADLIEKSEIQTYEDSFEATPQGIKFRGQYMGLFALTWETGASGEETGGGGTTTSRYVIEATAGEGGAISPSGRVSVTRGADKTFNIQAKDGYDIADVLVDGKSIGARDSYVFKNVRQKHTIEATFKKQGALPDEDATGVSKWLDTENHEAYLYGYPDGTFGSGRNMTRAEVAQMFYNLLLDKNVPLTATFKDVADDAWYAQAVHTLASLDLIKGVGNGNFAPTRAITRAEFSAMALRFASLEMSGEDIFSDVATTDWFYDAVLSASAYGWVVGFEDGTFRPQKTITRAEVTAIVNRMLGRSGDHTYIDHKLTALHTFPDVPKHHWAFYDIMEATNGHSYHKIDGKESWTALND